jgi:hypothetical protein
MIPPFIPFPVVTNGDYDRGEMTCIEFQDYLRVTVPDVFANIVQ